MAGDYHIEDIYGGGYSTLDPTKGELFTGYRIPAGSIGLATDPRTANVISDVSEKLKSGAKQIEVATIQPVDFDSIPRQHLQEVNRIAKLAGADISVHGIIAEPSGVSQQQGYSEIAREEAERQMLSNVLRAHEMSPDGNVPVTFHTSAGFPSTEYRPVEENGKKTFEAWRMPVINQETGQISLVQSDKMYVQGATPKEFEEGIKKSAVDHIRMKNNTEWDQSLAQIEFNRENAERILKDVHDIFIDKYIQVRTGHLGWKDLSSEEKAQIGKVFSAAEYMKQADLSMQNVFDRARKYGTEEEKKKLFEASEQYRKVLGIDNNGHLVNYNYYNPVSQSEALFALERDLVDFRPELYKPLEEFAAGKAAETFGNVAFGSYKKFKDKSPIISIENPPVGMGLSRAEDLQKIVGEARNKFVENAMKSPDQGGLSMSKSEAEKQAEKLIGVTWDVGHINMIRKQGYSEKDVIKESEKIAPFVKHVHLSDNFGMEHTELPMGMGNVPIAEIMKKLGQKGFEAKKVIEAGQWWQHFKVPPFQETLGAFGSPIYGMKMAPYWNQAVTNVGYFGGYGNMLPQVNYETMGAGFSMLPSELGGQRPGARGSRMSGRGME